MHSHLHYLFYNLSTLPTFDFENLKAIVNKDNFWI